MRMKRKPQFKYKVDTFGWIGVPRGCSLVRVLRYDLRLSTQEYLNHDGAWVPYKELEYLGDPLAVGFTIPRELLQILHRDTRPRFMGLRLWWNRRAIIHALEVSGA